MRTSVAKWGNSVAVRLPKALADELGLTPGREVDVSSRDGRLEIVATSRIPVYRIEDLVARMKPEDEPETVDWGPDIGSEIIDDDYSRGR